MDKTCFDEIRLLGGDVITHPVHVACFGCCHDCDDNFLIFYIVTLYVVIVLASLLLPLLLRVGPWKISMGSPPVLVVHQVIVMVVLNGDQNHPTSSWSIFKVDNMLTVHYAFGGAPVPGNAYLLNIHLPAPL